MVDFYESFYNALYGRNLDIQGYKIGLNPPCSEWQIICELSNDINSEFFASNKIIKLFEQYIINKLKQEYLFDSDTQVPSIKYSPKIGHAESGAYNRNTNEILVPSGFGQDQQAIILNFNTLAHELRHFAQAKGKRKDGLTLNPTILQTNLNSLNSALSYKNLTEQEKLEATKGADTPAHRKYYDKGMYYNLIAARDYYDDEVEMDARGFALTQTLELFDFINNPDLHLSNKKLKEIYNKQLEATTESEREKLELSETTSDEEYEIYSNSVKDLRESILAKYPDILDLYANDHKQYLQICKKQPYKLFTILCQSLEISYDDQFAHKLVDSYIESYSKNAEASAEFSEFMRMLYVTPIELTETQRSNIQFLFGQKALKTIDEMQEYSREKMSTQNRIRQEAKEHQFDGFLETTK